jgi:hypothetical protein
MSNNFLFVATLLTATFFVPSLTACQDSSVGAHEKVASEARTDFESTLKTHIQQLAVEIGERNLKRYESLGNAADYIDSQFKELGFETTRQSFEVRRLKCHNIAAEIKGTTKPEEIIIIGSHYDTAEGTSGANDNGSGTAAMLTLAKHLKDYQPQRTLRFVAFTNEEPPYFQTRDQMGSWVYAKMCRKEEQKIIAVLSLETMGYYTDKENSQNYPSPLDKLYPSTGNFVGFVSNVPSGKLLRTVLKSFKEHSKVPSEGASLPGNMPGVGWSDHWSFWQEGYAGVMVTDTAPFRYPHYHKASDTPDKINFPIFAKVVEGLVIPIQELTETTTLPTK